MTDKNFNLSKNAIKQFKGLYCLYNETIQNAFKRVSKEFAKNKNDEEMSYKLLSKGIWRPNTPVWLNAGTNHKIFSACFVTSISDSMDSIYDVTNVARKIFQFGAGVGIPIGNLRESNAYIYEGNPDKIPEGKSSGPITFLKLFDAVGATTKSGGRIRRAAILCSMPIWHPDIMEFIKCKQIDGQLSNMNISISVTDKFMKCLDDKVTFNLNTPYDGSKVGELNSQELWDELITNSHKSAEPGFLFIDTINEMNPLKEKILIECTNPCGEQPMIPFLSCNLSAINVSKFVNNGKFEWDKFYNNIFDIMGLMDNLIDIMDFPDDRFKENVLKYRPVGIGPMGMSDAMYMLNYKYDGIDGKNFAGKIMKTITTASVHKSALIAKERGPFFEYDIHKKNMENIIEKIIGYNKTEKLDITDEVMELVKKYGLSNCQHSTAAPTGCLTDNALISSKNGLKKIIEYKNEKFKKLTTKSDFGISHIKNYYDQGYQYTKKIITKNGYELEGTYDHKVRILNEKNYYRWKRLKDIKKGDKVVMKKGFLIDKKSCYNNCYSELIGLYMAKGWWSLSWSDKSYKLSLLINKKEKTHIIKLINKCFKQYELNIISKSEKDGKCRIEVNNNKIYNWFKKHKCIKNGFENAFIPNFILCGSRNNMLSFIKRFWINNRNFKEIGFITISKKMVDVLHTLLLGLGYPSNKTIYSVGENETIKIGNKIINKYSDVYKINIKRFYSEKLLKEMKLKLLKNKRNNPYKKLVSMFYKLKLFLYKSNNKSTTLSNYNSVMNNKDWFKSNDLLEQEVNEIIDSKQKVHVNDLEVFENTHTYIANGFVTHNTTALSCDASYGIEPIFGLVFQKNYIDGEKALIVNPIFEEKFKNEEWFTKDLLNKIFKNEGSLKGLHGIPKEVREVFVVAHDIKWKDRIDMQASLQSFCSTAISSTVNLPKNATKEEVSDLVKYAYKQKLKGVTVYRDGSRKDQPVTFTDNKKEDVVFKRPKKLISNTYIVETGNGKMYVTICDYNGKPLEIFIHIGKSGQMVNTFTEALGRVISIAFQNGVPVEQISKTLININSDKVNWFRFEESDKKPDQILSIPDGIAKLLNRYYTGMNKYEGELECEICPECGESLNATEGCYSCTSCGYSKCS